MQEHRTGRTIKPLENEGCDAMTTTKPKTPKSRRAPKATVCPAAEIGAEMARCISIMYQYEDIGLNARAAKDYPTECQSDEFERAAHDRLHAMQDALSTVPATSIVGALVQMLGVYDRLDRLDGELDCDAEEIDVNALKRIYDRDRPHIKRLVLLIIHALENQSGTTLEKLGLTHFICVGARALPRELEGGQ